MKPWLFACLALSSANAAAGGPATQAAVGDEPLNLDAALAGDGALEIQIALLDYGAAGFMESGGDMVLFGSSDDGNASQREGIMLRLANDGTQTSMTGFGSQGFGCHAPRSFLTAMRLRSGDYLTGGYVQTNCSGVPRFFNALALQPSGIRLAEFDHVVFNNQLAYIFGLAEQADGKLVGVGLISSSGFDNATYDFGIARFHPDGVLDNSFGSGGTFTFDLAGGLDYARQAVVTPDGQILVCGFGTNANGDIDVLVLALTSEGVLDPSFGSGGVFQYDRGGFNDSVSGIVRSKSGRIFLAAGTRVDETNIDLTVIGLTEDGALDPGFAGDGIAIMDFGTPVAAASAITIGLSGEIIVAGSGEFGGLGREFRDGVLAVLLQDGRMDPKFNNGAGVTFTFGNQPAHFPQHVSVNELGTRILVSGFTDNADRTVQRFGVARFIGLDQIIFSAGFETVQN